jgi:hypothetical protein
MTKVFEVSERDLARKFREVESKRPDAVVRGIASAVLASAELVAQMAPKDLGNLKRSCRGVLQPGGGYVIVDAPHAGIVEAGARPHWAPIAPLIDWARRHADSEAEAQRMARGTQVKIACEGQSPTYWVRRSLPKQKKILKAEVEREMRRGE